MKKKDYKLMVQLCQAELIRERKKNKEYLLIIHKLNKMNRSLASSPGKIKDVGSPVAQEYANKVSQIINPSEDIKKEEGPTLDIVSNKTAKSTQEIKLPSYLRDEKSTDSVITAKDIEKVCDEVAVITRATTSYKDVKMLGALYDRAAEWGKVLKDNGYDPNMFIWVKDYKDKLYPKIEVNLGQEEVQFELDSYMNVREIHIKTFPIINGRRIRRDISSREASNEAQKVITLIAQSEHLRNLKNDLQK